MMRKIKRGELLALDDKGSWQILMKEWMLVYDKITIRRVEGYSKPTFRVWTSQPRQKEKS